MHNRALGSGEGGALFLQSASISPAPVLLSHCAFEANEAQRGGAVAARGGVSAEWAVESEHCTFLDNQARAPQGGNAVMLTIRSDTPFPHPHSARPRHTQWLPPCPASG